MRIQIDGTNTVNKGAELMLYAVLQEIERQYPKAEVFYNRIGEKSSYIQTSLNFKTRPFSNTLIPALNKFKASGILRRLSLPYSFFTQKYAMANMDIILDAGGFQFSDQWNRTCHELLLWEEYYSELKEQGTKIVLLPQAFGPFQTKNGERSAKMISKYADIIFAREIVSYNHLVNAGVDENKIKLYPDFTTLVEGVFPKQYESVIGDVCIIPNMRMIDKDAIAKESYLLLMIQIIEKIRKNGERPFLLNHGGKDDALLCKMINDKLDKLLIIADNLTALEVKGIISQSSMLISSRFHGVASALNSGVPCLATSWSHKYEELFKDYGQSDCLMNLNDIEENLNKINFHLQKHEEVSNHLENMKATIIEKNREMWNIVWKYNG